MAKIFGGYSHTFSLVNNRVYATGQNNHGQLGLGDYMDRTTPQLVEFFIGKNIQQLVCGHDFSFAIADGFVYAWGHNVYGELGLGDRSNRLIPQLVEFFVGKNVQQLVCGTSHSLAIADDRVYAWGSGDFGKLGLGNEIDRLSPQLVEFFTDKNVQQLICGGATSLAVSDGRVYAWGNGRYNQLGIVDRFDQLILSLVKFFADEHFYQQRSQITPQLVKFFVGKNIQQIVRGSTHSFAIADGQVYGWGNNENGQLGLGNCLGQSTPQLVEFFVDKNIEQLVCGSNFSLALVDNNVYAWGLNNCGQLGLGNNTKESTPRLVEFFVGKDVQLLACGYEFSFAVSNNKIYGWGGNTEGQLGLGHHGGNINMPQLIEYFDNAEIWPEASEKIIKNANKIV